MCKLEGIKHKSKPISRESITNEWISENLKQLNLSRDEIISIIATMLLTDGFLYKYKRYKKSNSYEATYKGKDIILHKIYRNLILLAFEREPNEYLKSYNENGTLVYRTILRGEEPAKCLLNKSPVFRTSPKNLDKDTFLELFKPTLKSTYNLRKEVKKMILQLAMGAEGYVSIRFERNFRIAVGFSCAHPILVKQWKKLFNDIGIRFSIKKFKDTWSGIGGLETSDLKQVKKFTNKIGFIDDLKVWKGYWRGYTKKELLDAALQFNKLLKYGSMASGIPIKYFKTNWLEIFRNIDQYEINKQKKRILKRINSVIKKVNGKISPYKILNVIQFLEHQKRIDKMQFQEFTNLTGANAWSRFRKIATKFYGNKLEIHPKYVILGGDKNTQR